MTNITVVKSDEYTVAYRVVGHTDFDEYGKDIACSAVSFMSQTVILALNEVCGIDKKDINFKIEDGFLAMARTFDLPKEQVEKAEIVMQTMITGYISLAKEYPDNITLKFEEVDL